ncbi:hypothetical protein [Alteromonas lipotrueiana]|uniref:hypothetical protein n=1 Tax=Alteromonas lipotrueiana TaxID=2803815 RepID=UPI001C46B2B6|nr:hypothetical protein [Alteromonas lipotrueiana]
MFSRPKKNRQVIVDRQILHLHQAMAEKCLTNPDLFDEVLNNLEHKHQLNFIGYGSYLLWHAILEARDNPHTFKELLLASDSRTKALRRKTIFGGVLSEAEREAVLTTYIASELA